MRALLTLCLFVGSCATTASSSPPPATPIFATPIHGFTIPAQADEVWTMERLVLEYGRATETRFLFDASTLDRLKSSNVPIGDELVLEPNAMHSVVESLLVEMGCLLGVVRAEAPRIVSVHHGRGAPSGTVPFVDVADLDQWREHPAYLIRTTLILDASDTRFISNALRATLHDAGRLQIIPLGEANGLLIQGPGPWVAELARMLLDVNEREREFAEKAQPLEEPR